MKAEVPNHDEMEPLDVVVKRHDALLYGVRDPVTGRILKVGLLDQINTLSLGMKIAVPILILSYLHITPPADWLSNLLNMFGGK